MECKASISCTSHLVSGRDGSVMTGRMVFQRKRIVLLAVGWMAIALPVLGQGAATDAKRPAFDVAAIKLNKAGQGWRFMGTADGYSATNAPLKMLIKYAYDLKMDDQISGLPGWADSAHFDIQAKMDEDTLAAFKKLSAEDGMKQRRLMMQSLLEDRFQLRVHHVSKQLPIFDLVVAKGGFKLKDADPKNASTNGIKGPDGVVHGGMMWFDGRHLKAQAIPISDLANMLSNFLNREVVNKTGLAGKYDFTLEWSPDDNQGPKMLNGQQDATDTGPSIFTALQEQLGLKLDATKGPVDTIVVDHVEMPSEN